MKLKWEGYVSLYLLQLKTTLDSCIFQVVLNTMFSKLLRKYQSDDVFALLTLENYENENKNSLIKVKKSH